MQSTQLLEIALGSIFGLTFVNAFLSPEEGI